MLIDSNQCTRSFSFRIDNLNPFRSSRFDTICANASLSVGKSSYTISGRYSDSLISSKGCDSIVTTYLTVNAPIDYTLKATDPTCNGLDDGSLIISGTNGYPTYAYALNGKMITLAQLSKVPSGNYVINVTQARTTEALDAYYKAAAIASDAKLRTDIAARIADITTEAGDACEAAKQLQVAVDSLCVADRTDWVIRAQDAQFYCKASFDVR